MRERQGWGPRQSTAARRCLVGKHPAARVGGARTRSRAGTHHDELHVASDPIAGVLAQMPPGTTCRLVSPTLLPPASAKRSWKPTRPRLSASQRCCGRDRNSVLSCGFGGGCLCLVGHSAMDHVRRPTKPMRHNCAQVTKVHESAKTVRRW